MKTIQDYIKEDIFDVENIESAKDIKGYEIKDMGEITSITGDRINISKKESISKYSKLISASIINRENFEELVNISRITGIKNFSFDYDAIIDIDGSMDFLNTKICCERLYINNNLNTSNLNIKCSLLKIMKTSKFKNCDIDCARLQLYDHKIPKFINCNIKSTGWMNDVRYDLFIDKQLEDKVLNEFNARQLIKEFNLNNIPSSTSEPMIGLCVVGRDWSKIDKRWMMLNKFLNKGYFKEYDIEKGKMIGDWKIVER